MQDLETDSVATTASYQQQGARNHKQEDELSQRIRATHRIVRNSILFYSKKSRLRQRKCRSTTTAQRLAAWHSW